MQHIQITIGPITLALTTIIAFFVGMIFMRICFWNYKRVKTEIINVDGPQFRPSNDDESDIEEKMKNAHPKCQSILSINCIRRVSSLMDKSWEDRIYEIKYI